MDDLDIRYDSERGRPVDGYEPIIDFDHYDLSRYELTPEEIAYEEMIRQRIRDRRRAAERRRVKRNRTVALILLLIIVMIICRGCYASRRKKRDEEAGAKVSASSKAEDSKPQESEAPDESKPEVSEHKLQQVEGLTFVDGILIVNKTYSLPADYAPGINTAAQAAFDDMVAAAFNDGLYLYANSGYRTYEEQETLYRKYAEERGVAEADRVSSRPGYSEHQSGLCFDVNSTDFSFAETTEAKWIAAHCAEYGFIIRFPKGKEAFTGYEYEPWHIRFVGVDVAKDMTAKGVCLEEYLGVTSSYEKAADGISQQRMAEKLGVTVEDPTGGTANGGGQDNGYTEEQPEQSWDNNGYDYGNDYDYNYDYNYDYGYGYDDNYYDNGYDYNYDNGYYDDNYYGY